jgi:hypothetical protein
VHPAQDFRAILFRRLRVRLECAFGRRDSAPRVFFITQHDAAKHLLGGRVDALHGFSAMGFDERSVNVMFRDGPHPAFSRIVEQLGCIVGSAASASYYMFLVGASTGSEPFGSAILAAHEPAANETAHEQRRHHLQHHSRGSHRC